MQRLMSFLVGADGNLLARCPPGDRDNVATIGWLLLGVWVWQVIVLSVALHVGLAPDGAIQPAYVGLAMLVATLVLLFDSYIVRASWLATGSEQLARSGLQLPQPWTTQIKNAFFMILRLGMTLLLALLPGSLMSLMFFRKDIDARIDAIAARANAPLVAVASERFDAETARLKTERGTALAAVNAADADASALRQSVLREAEADPERGFLVERVRLLTRAREAAERRAAQLRRR